MLQTLHIPAIIIVHDADQFKKYIYLTVTNAKN